jgi:hypothetical protein
MWIESIRLVVQTKNQRYTGTDSLQAIVLRDYHTLQVLELDCPTWTLNLA